MSTLQAPGAPTARELVEALAAAASSLDARQGIAFLTEPTDVDVTAIPSLSNQLASLVRHMDGTETWLDGTHAPTTLRVGWSRGHHAGGLTFFRGDAFPTDFFKRQHQLHAQPTASSSSPRPGELFVDLSDVPWFEWDASTRRFAFHERGAGARLLEHLEASCAGNKQLSLFRGTTRYEAALLELAQATRGGTVPEGWREALRDALATIVEHARVDSDAYAQLVREGCVDEAAAAGKRSTLEVWQALLAERGAAAERVPDRAGPRVVDEFARQSLAYLLRVSPFAGEFVTADEQRAAAFSKGRVIELAWSFADLRRLHADQRLYIGVEHLGDQTAVELGFFARGDERGIVDALVRSYVGATQVAAGQLFN